MTEATGVTYRKIKTSGEETLYELACTANRNSGFTMTIPASGEGSHITTSSKVKIVSINNLTSGTCLGTITATYTAASRLFTITESGKTNEAYRVEFRVVNT